VYLQLSRITPPTGLVSTVFFRDYTVATPSAFVVPAGTKLVDPFSRFLSGNGQITHVVNGQGATVNAANPLAYVCT